jgi:hypothetical protein
MSVDLGVVRDATFSTSLFIKVEWTMDRFFENLQIAKKTADLSAHSPVCPRAF